MTRARLTGVVAATAPALAAAALLGACAPFSAPAARSRPPSALAQAQRTHEYPSPSPHEAALTGLASPGLAVRAFAVGYTNWTAATVSGRMRGLAALSVGQARAAMTLAAAQTARDYELHRGGIANTGSVESVAPLPGAPGRWVVVTLERTTAAHDLAYQGLAPAWHVSVATVRRVSGGWAVSGWQPES